MVEKKKKKRISGGKYLKETGKVGVLVALTAEQAQAIDAACLIDGRKRAGFITHYAIPHAIEIAKNILENNPKRR